MGEFSGRFGFSGSLRLESAGGLLPATVRTGTEATPLGPVEYAELARNVPLAADHTYAATLSYDGTTGLAAVALIDQSDDSIVYDGHLYIRPASGPRYAGVGGLRLDGGTQSGWRLRVDEMAVLPEVRRLGRPIPLKEVRIALAGGDGEAPIDSGRAAPSGRDNRVRPPSWLSHRERSRRGDIMSSLNTSNQTTSPKWPEGRSR